MKHNCVGKEDDLRYEFRRHSGDRGTGKVEVKVAEEEVEAEEEEGEKDDRKPRRLQQRMRLHRLKYRHRQLRYLPAHHHLQQRNSRPRLKSSSLVVTTFDFRFEETT